MVDCKNCNSALTRGWRLLDGNKICDKCYYFDTTKNGFSIKKYLPTATCDNCGKVVKDVRLMPNVDKFICEKCQEHE